MAKMSEKRDDKFDKSRGIKEKSKKDMKIDRKRGLPSDRKGRSRGR